MNISPPTVLILLANVWNMKHLAASLSTLAFTCVLNASETLYNGIVLPDVWPPRLADFPSAQ